MRDRETCESYKKECVWKGVIERDAVLYGRAGRTGLQLRCFECEGSDESCIAYLPKCACERKKFTREE